MHRRLRAVIFATYFVRAVNYDRKICIRLASTEELTPHDCFAYRAGLSAAAKNGQTDNRLKHFRLH